MQARKRIGIMTGGGDAPGLNGIIEAVVRALDGDAHEVVGIYDGFEGIFTGQTVVLHREAVEGAHARAGTLLGTSNRCGTAGREEEFRRQLAALALDGLVVAGGDGTFAGLACVAHEVPIIGVPKTIDNDLAGTDVTFGFDTACAVVAEAVDALRATAQAHRRAIVVETMGRTAGWIALGGGLAACADAILIPERPFDRTSLATFLTAKHAAGHRGLVLVVSEGAMAAGEDPTVAFRVEGSPQPDRYGGIGERVARWLETATPYEGRHVVLGHLQRSRHPTTTDRFLTLSMGAEVAHMVADEAWGQAVVYRHGQVTRAPLADLMQPPRLVAPDHRWLRLAHKLGIFV